LAKTKSFSSKAASDEPINNNENQQPIGPKLSKWSRQHVTYETKWKQTEIKSFRLSPSLLEMIQSECRARRTDFSEFMRHAAIATMKRGRYQAVME
jgi:hypothetical protein